ncbi:hypothetical protein Q3G72_009472 [Acer saccharum]|nr:hypothetical protein Q3G72_009472 [Acer saccharum]
MPVHCEFCQHCRFMNREEFGIDLIADSMQNHHKMKFLQPLNLFKESLKREALKRNQLLGLNVGDRFLSLALSDPENITAVPLRVWPTVLYDKASVADTIQTLRVEFLSNHHVEFIKSLSLPKHLSEKCIEQLAAWHMLQGYLDYSNMLVAIDKDDADLFGGN